MWRTTALAAATMVALVQASMVANANNFDRGGFRGSNSGLTELGRDTSGELFGRFGTPSRDADGCGDRPRGDGVRTPCG